MKKLGFNKQLLALLIFFIIQLTAFFVITFRPISITPPGHTYLFTAKATCTPIFLYPNHILQAKNGAWGIKDTHTTQPQGRTYSVWFFVLAGKLSNLFHLEPVQMFILLQLSGGIAVFIATYIFIRTLLPPKYQMPAIFFSLMFEISPLSLTSLTPVLPGFITPLRNFGLPHHAWGEALGLLSLLFLIRKKWYRIIYLYPPKHCVSAPCHDYARSVCVSSFVYMGTLEKKRKKTIPLLCVSGFAVIIVGLQTKLAFSAAGYPWSAWSLIEKSWWKSSDAVYLYAQSLTLYIPFFILLAITSLYRWKSWPESVKLSYSYYPLGLSCRFSIYP